MDHTIDVENEDPLANGPPRMSQEVQPQNLAELFADHAPDCAADVNAGASQIPSRGLAFAGARPDDDFDMKKLQVFVRIRPNAGDGAQNCDGENCIHASSKHSLAIAPPESSLAYRSGDRGQTFTVSQVMDAATTQEEYFLATAGPLVQDWLRDPRHNSVMLAYGITAAGKTYTIEGTKTAPGVLPRALAAAFDGLASHVERESLSVQVSYCEIYNEAVYDLLEEPAAAWPRQRQALRLMEDSKGRVSVAGLSQVIVTSSDEAMAVLRRGARHRQRAETGLNYNSSRSHSIFSIHLVRRVPLQPNDDIEDDAEVALIEENERPTEAALSSREERLGRMVFVDLAGSERAQRTGNVGIRLKESVAINSSLMTLGRCLEALRWNQLQQTLARNGGQSLALRVVPYRESKVTHLFRDALHGYGRVILSVNVSPCARDYDETSHVLRYAALATHIGTLQQAEAPRRTIKAVTPSALRRAKRKAAAIEAAKKRAKLEKQQEPKQQQRQGFGEQSTTIDPEAEETDTFAASMPPKEEKHPHASFAEEAALHHDSEKIIAGGKEDGCAHGLACSHDLGDDALVYDVLGHAPSLIHREEQCPLNKGNGAIPDRKQLCQGGDDADGEDLPLEGSLHDAVDVSPQPNQVALAHSPEWLSAGGAGAYDGTPSTPLTGFDEAAAEAIAALQAQVQDLITKLQAAEERAVLVEGEIRDEVASEMAQLLKDMEESYRDRLAAEIEMVEARAAKGGGGAGGKKRGKGKRERQTAAAEDTSSVPTAVEDAVKAAETATAALQVRLCSAAEELATANATIEGLRAELDARKAEAECQTTALQNAQAAAEAARAQAEAAAAEAAAARAEAETERSNAAMMAEALQEARACKERLASGGAHDGYSQRLQEEVTQLEANQAMQLEMAEHQLERLRKENASLQQRLGATLAALEQVSSPSRPLVHRLAMTCPAGNGCGAAGTPHDVALARARAASAAEDAAAAMIGTSGGGDMSFPKPVGGSQAGSSHGKQRSRSRFAEEAAAVAMHGSQPEVCGGKYGLPVSMDPVQEEVEEEVGGTEIDIADVAHRHRDEWWLDEADAGQGDGNGLVVCDDKNSMHEMKVDGDGATGEEAMAGIEGALPVDDTKRDAAADMIVEETGVHVESCNLYDGMDKQADTPGQAEVTHEQTGNDAHHQDTAHQRELEASKHETEPHATLLVHLSPFVTEEEHLRKECGEIHMDPPSVETICGDIDGACDLAGDDEENRFKGNGNPCDIMQTEYQQQARREGSPGATSEGDVSSSSALTEAGALEKQGRRGKMRRSRRKAKANAKQQSDDDDGGLSKADHEVPQQGSRAHRAKNTNKEKKVRRATRDESVLELDLGDDVVETQAGFDNHNGTLVLPNNPLHGDDAQLLGQNGCTASISGGQTAVAEQKVDLTALVGPDAVDIQANELSRPSSSPLQFLAAATKDQDEIDTENVCVEVSVAPRSSSPLLLVSADGRGETVEDELPPRGQWNEVETSPCRESDNQDAFALTEEEEKERVEQQECVLLTKQGLATTGNTSRGKRGRKIRTSAARVARNARRHPDSRVLEEDMVGVYPNKDASLHASASEPSQVTDTLADRLIETANASADMRCNRTRGDMAMESIREDEPMHFPLVSKNNAEACVADGNVHGPAAAPRESEENARGSSEGDAAPEYAGSFPQSTELHDSETVAIRRAKQQLMPRRMTRRASKAVAEAGSSKGRDVDAVKDDSKPPPVVEEKKCRRGRRLLTPAKPLTAEMRSALGEVACGELVSTQGVAGRGQKVLTASMLSPPPALRQRNARVKE